MLPNKVRSLIKAKTPCPCLPPFVLWPPNETQLCTSSRRRLSSSPRRSPPSNETPERRPRSPLADWSPGVFSPSPRRLPPLLRRLLLDADPTPTPNRDDADRSPIVLSLCALHTLSSSRWTPPPSPPPPSSSPSSVKVDRASNSSNLQYISSPPKLSENLAMVSQSAMEPSPILGLKKRALEAIERRLAFDKAEQLRREDHKNKKSKRDPKDEGSVLRGQRGEDQATVASPPELDSSKKGRVVFSGHTPSRETSGVAGEGVHPAYSELPQFVHENLAGNIMKASSKGDVVNKIMFSLLQHGDKGHKYTRGSIAIKVDNCLLLDNFVPKRSWTDARVKALQSHSKRSKKHMSLREHRKYGSYDFPKKFHNFKHFTILHELWKEHIIGVIHENREKQIPDCLLMANLVGAYIYVVVCRTTAFQGISGIMVRETAETFGLITRGNQFQVVPKRGSVFLFRADSFKVTLHGNRCYLRNIAA